MSKAKKKGTSLSPLNDCCNDIFPISVNPYRTGVDVVLPARQDENFASLWVSRTTLRWRTHPWQAWPLPQIFNKLKSSRQSGLVSYFHFLTYDSIYSKLHLRRPQHAVIKMSSPVWKCRCSLHPYQHPQTVNTLISLLKANWCSPRIIESALGLTQHPSVTFLRSMWPSITTGVLCGPTRGLWSFETSHTRFDCRPKVLL